MLGEVVHPGLFFQHDSPSGPYDDVPRRRGWQGPSLRYRKLEKLERDPVFAAFIGNPLFARIARAVIGPEVSLCRAVLFTKAAQRRHGAALAPGRRLLLGSQPRPRAADLDRARRRAGRVGLRGAGSAAPTRGPGHAARRRHPGRRRRAQRQRGEVDPGAGASGRGAAHPQPLLAPVGPERHRRAPPRPHRLPDGRGHPLHATALAAASSAALRGRPGAPYFLATWCSANAAPCGSMSWATRPPGTSMGPFRTLAPFFRARPSAASRSFVSV